MTAARVATTAAFAGLWTLLAIAAALAPRLTGNSFDMLLPALLTITGQWFLLRDRTWWATRWAVCGVVGSLVPAIAGIVLHVLAPQSLLPRSPLYASLGLAATALPAVLGLLPIVGPRALALLLAPMAAWAMRQYGIGPVLSPLLSDTPPHWPPVVLAVPPAVRAVVEAGVLTWLIAVTHRRPQASIQERPAVAAAASSALGLLVPLWMLAGLVLFLMHSVLSSGSRGYVPPPGQTLLIVLVLAPYVVGLGSTFVPMARPFGLSALAVGAGGVALIGAPVAASRGGWLLLGGLAGLLVLALPALHGALAAIAFRAMWLTTASHRRSVALVSGAVAILLYAIAGQAGFSVLRTKEADQRAAEARARPEARVSSVRDALNRCFYVMARASAAPVWPRTIDDLGPNGLRCLTADELRPADKAYAIHVTAPAGDAPTAAFDVCVSRIADGRVDARVVTEHPYHGSEAKQGDTVATACAGAAEGALGRARHCLWDWAATHDGAYPESLAPLMAGGCLGRTVSGDGGMGATYVAGSRGADGRIATFVMIYGPTKDDGIGATRFRLDETGAIRSTREPRLPITRDPLDRAWQPRPSDSRRRGDQSGDVDWARTCDAGRLADCVALGQVLEARAARWSKVIIRAADDALPRPLAAVDGRSLADVDLARAADAYASACRAGGAEACAHAGRLLLKGPASVDRDRDVWALRSRACTLGDGASCDAQSADDAPGRPLGGPTDVRAMSAACAGGVRTACAAAGRLAAARGGSPDDVLELYLSGCDLGDAEACLEASRLLDADASLAADPGRADRRRAESLRAIACSVAPKPAGCTSP